MAVEIIFEIGFGNEHLPAVPDESYFPFYKDSGRVVGPLEDLRNLADGEISFSKAHLIRFSTGIPVISEMRRAVWAPNLRLPLK